MSRLAFPSSEPWITKDGSIDLAKLPLDGILAQVTSGARDKVQDGLRVLAAVQQAGRLEAGIFLLGFLANLPFDDLEMRHATVEALQYFQTASCAATLVQELRRVKSSNVTRRYLTTILDVLSRFPANLIERELETLAVDPGFSYKMRARFRETIQMACYRNQNG